MWRFITVLNLHSKSSIKTNELMFIPITQIIDLTPRETFELPSYHLREEVPTVLPSFLNGHLVRASKNCYFWITLEKNKHLKLSCLLSFSIRPYNFTISPFLSAMGIVKFPIVFNFDGDVSWVLLLPIYSKHAHVSDATLCLNEIWSFKFGLSGGIFHQKCIKFSSNFR